MITFLRGTLVSMAPQGVASQWVLDVHGVGYAVTVAKQHDSALNPDAEADDAPNIGDEVILHTHLRVREDSWVLYGFLVPDARRVFELLITVKGVGPRLAADIIAYFGIEHTLFALAGEEGGIAVRLQDAPGVGAKLVARAKAELHEKAGELMAELGIESPTSPQPAPRKRVVAESKEPPHLRRARQALRGLGFSDREIDTSIESAAPELDTLLAAQAPPADAAVIELILKRL